MNNELNKSGKSACYYALVARKNRTEKNQNEGLEPPRHVSAEAVRGVLAIFFVAIAVFLILARFNVGGFVGSVIYKYLSWLLGIGYLLLPLSLLLLAILIFKSFDRHFGLIQLLSMFVFLLSGLSLIDLAFPGDGGVLGAAVSNPITAAVDVAATAIFLTAFVIASLIVAFDIQCHDLPHQPLQATRCRF